MFIIYNPISVDRPQVTDQTAIDFDAIVTQGEYTGIGVTTTNGPASDTNTEFKLLVHVASNGDITQTLMDKAGTNVRTYSASAWGAWA